MRRNRSIVLATCAAFVAAGIVFAADTPESKPTPPAKPASARSGLTKPASPAPAPAPAPSAATGDDALATIGFDRSAEVDSAVPAAPKPSASVPQPRTEYKPVVKKNATGKDVVVITNDQLEHLYGRSAPPRPPAGETAVTDAPPEGAAHVAAAAAGADTNPEHLRAELDRLDRKAKYLKNPFLQPPPLSEQELAADRNLTKTQAIERTQQQMDKLKQQLKQSEAAAAGGGEHK